MRPRSMATNFELARAWWSASEWSVGMVYLTKSQRGSGTLFLALPCRNCGCGIKARTKVFKREADAEVQAYNRWRW